MNTQPRHRWEPLWLGERERVLYAACHSADTDAGSDRESGLVLVPPLLHELPRGRRLLMQIAEHLAAAGIHCLRFDFFGTGDSEGSGDQVDFGSMRADLDLAVRTLREVHGIRSISLLGVRGGALVVGDWLAKGGRADNVVLWEPIVDGEAWLDELRRNDAEELRSSDRYPGRHGVAVPAHPGQLMGLDVSTSFLEQLQSASFRPVAGTCIRSVLRPEVALAQVPLTQRFDLPADAAPFAGTRMDGAMFVTPNLQPVIEDVARAITATTPMGAVA